ncbi:MAG: helix-turn-helix domain-containing protein [Negativicutes bacterium]|nr:helix-turn-helix domain-containing protein [Negativicutes bacterium]
MANKLAEVLDFIKNYHHPYPPTVREIAAGVGLSSSATVHRYLYLLEQQGYIAHEPNCPRTIRVIK